MQQRQKRGTKRSAPTQPSPEEAPQSAGLALLASVGAGRKADGWVLAADSFRFRQQLDQQMRDPARYDELLAALGDEFAVSDKLRLALAPMRATDGHDDAAVKDSLVRHLLHVDALQTQVARLLLEKLPELQDESERPQAGVMTLTKLLLSQFKWLEHVVDGHALVETVREMLEVVEPPLKRDLVLVLPDLVSDGQHAAAVDILRDLLREDSQFTAPVLDSLGSLALPADLVEQVVELVTQSISSSNLTDVPVVIRFLMQHLTSDNAKMVVRELRAGLTFEALARSEDNRSGEALVLDALQSSLRLHNVAASLLLAQLDEIDKPTDRRPIDWWLLCALYSGGTSLEKKKALKLVQAKASRQQLVPSLMRAAIIGHGRALTPHFCAMLEIAGSQLPSTNDTVRALGQQLFALLFEEFGEPYQRQELLGHIVTHVGGGHTLEVDSALQVLVQLAKDDARGLAHFNAFLDGILDHLDSINVSQTRMAYELFARLAHDGSAKGGSRLTDELNIIIRKQLSSTSPKYKAYGMIGGCAMLDRLAARAPTAPGADAPPAMDPQRVEEASESLGTLLKHAHGPDGSYSFLLHELAHVVAARDAAGKATIAAELLELISDRITGDFETDFLTDMSEPAEAAEHGLVSQPLLNLDGKDASIAVNLLPILHGRETSAARRRGLSALSGTFQLLRLCEAATSDTGDDLEGVDAVLGCPINLCAPDAVANFDQLPDETRETVCLALFYAVDWIRELINAFATQEDVDMRGKVLTRLHQLVWLERRLNHCLGLTPNLRLPGVMRDDAAAARAQAKQVAKAEKEAAREAEKAVKSAAMPKKPKAKKRKTRGSDVDSSSDEDGDGTDAEAEAEAEPDAAAASSSKTPKASKAAAKPKAAAALGLQLKNLERFAPHLRGISIKTSVILTYNESITRKMMDTAGETAGAETFQLTPASMHYLLSHLHTKLKAALGGTARFPSATRSAAGNALAVQDLSSVELQGVDSAALLKQIKPVLLTFREHVEALHELLESKQHLRADPRLIDEVDILGAQSASAEDEEVSVQFAEPSLLLLLQCLQIPLKSKQLLDAECQAQLTEVLAHFGKHSAGVALASQAAAEQPQAAAEACAAAFDFFEALFPTLTSNATVSELVALQKAIVQMQERELRPGDDLGGSARRGRLSELAARYLASPCEDDRKSHPALVKALFECQTAYSTQPRELLDEWTEEILPELAESADRSSDQQPTLSLQTAPSFLVHLFALLDSQAKVLELPLKTKKGKEVQLRTEEVSAKLEELQWLTRAFVALILTTRTLSSATIIKQTIKHAATFLARFVSQALPFLSAHFKVQHQPICQLLKSLQPATRLLQAQCATVKQQQQVGALKGVVALKKELEGVVFGVKAMLQEHKCQDSFWLGNLKHKNAAGEEVSSQMQAAASIA